MLRTQAANDLTADQRDVAVQPCETAVTKAAAERVAW
jgi:hypothetical protein